MARTCYYELLGVLQGADDSELKKAYRKQALIWHPDKNHGNTEEATRIFAEIKEAYETLSDPQERAWYDNHREQILRGDDYAAAGGVGYEQSDKSANVAFISTESLMHFFTVSSFRGFNDLPMGFFAVYRTLFDRLRDEELQVSGLDTAERLDMIHNLSFGDSHTFYDEDAIYASAQGRSKRPTRKSENTGTTLRDFYNFWTTYSTRKSFGWYDKFRLSDAENRQIRRLMEKENKNLRDKAKREFVETVQKLASWLKRRDPRYKDHVERQHALQQERERERKRLVAEQRAAAIEAASSYVRQAWEEVDYTNLLDEFLSDDIASDGGSEGYDMPPDSEASEDGVDASEELDPANDLICFTCDKEFKTAAQKTNHEKSKKHQRAVREVRREMMREERQMAKATATATATAATAATAAAAAAATATATATAASTAATENTASEGDHGVGDDSDNSDFCKSPASNTGAAKDDVLSQMLRELTMAQAGKGKKGKKRRQRVDKVLDDTGESTSVAPAESINGSEYGSAQASKREARREKQKNKAAAGGSLACNVCNEGFTSRNQLFKHIADTGHALAGNNGPHKTKGSKRSTA
ncbi:hypothetical protein IW152_002116 [Coemansia sp. BCRC 34962]|nr:hypothetical protein IW152_002116 [Coemansia sp. BCRC 34962]